MKISIITLFPKMISGFFEESIIKRAIEKKLVEIEIMGHDPFGHKHCDTRVSDRPARRCHLESYAVLHFCHFIALGPIRVEKGQKIG